MKNQLLLFLLITCCTAHAQKPFNDSIALIKRNYINATLDEDEGKRTLLKQLAAIPQEQEVSDQNVIELQQLYPISSKEIKYLTNTLCADGSWKDINYKDSKRSGWEPKIHAERILKLAKYYYQKRQQLKPVQISRLTNTIHQAMNFWFKHELICPNWWYNQIGIPRTLGPAFLLFEQEMSEEEKQAAVKVMMNSAFGMTGQNKVWLAGNVLIRALLENDWELTKDAREVITSEITLGQKEGIKADWSFHQHGPQQQFGNYGLSFLCNMSFYSELFAGTSLAFSQEQQKILTSLLLEGYQWIIWRGYWDVNGLNRQLFRNADVDKGFRLLFAAYSLMKSSEPEVAGKIQEMIDRNSTSSQVPNTFTGNKHFCESDYTIHRTPAWMASVRMASERVIGTELVNEDNLKGYYMADGALYTYVRGDEYHNIFPFWDWRRIPGITTYENNAPIPNPNKTDSRNHSSCVGGVTYQHTGITAMQLKRNKLEANKTWVFTDDYVLCMGSNIHADSTATIMTSIDQRFSKDKVWSEDNKRFFHDNTGYIILQADTCIAVTENKEGQWKDFMGMYKPEMLKNKLFSIYLKHRKDMPASYIYLTLPATTQQKVRKFDSSPIHILRNDKEAQAVVIKDLCYVSVYHPTQILIESQNPIVISEPGTYIIHTQKGNFVAHTPFTAGNSI